MEGREVIPHPAHFTNLYITHVSPQDVLVFLAQAAAQPYMHTLANWLYRGLIQVKGREMDRRRAQGVCNSFVLTAVHLLSNLGLLESTGPLQRIYGCRQ